MACSKTEIGKLKELMRDEIFKLGTIRFNENVFLDQCGEHIEYTVKVSIVNKKDSNCECVAHIKVDNKKLLNVIVALFSNSKS